MPYANASDTSLPPYVRKKPLRKRQQWVAVFNSVYKQTQDESHAFAAANAAVKIITEIANPFIGQKHPGHSSQLVHGRRGSFIPGPMPEHTWQALREQRAGYSANSELALDLYQQTEGAQRINRYLRGQLEAGHPDIEEQARAATRGIDDAFKKSSLNDDTRLYRGAAPNIEFLQPGQSFTDKGYVSTSVELDTAKRFGIGPIVEIQARKGQPAISGTFAEREVILPRDTTFKVIDRSRYTYRGILEPEITRTMLTVEIE